MVEAIKSVFDFLIEQGYSLFTVVIILAMTTLVFIILTLLKKPIKALTNKIKNERLRKLANKSIILLAFGLAVGLWFLANKIAPSYFSVNGVEILLTGALPVVAYALGDGVLTKASAKAIVGTILEVTEDGKVSKEDAKTVIEKVQTEVQSNTAAKTETKTEAKAEKKSEATSEPKSEAENALNDLLNN